MKAPNLDEQLKYYKETYAEVALVSCENCKSPLAFEVKGGPENAGNPMHPEGRQVIPVSYTNHPLQMALLSWRPRTDGLIGYECGAVVDNPEYQKELERVEAKFAEDDAAYKKAATKFDKDIAKYDAAHSDWQRAIKKIKKPEDYPPEPARPSDPVEPVRGEIHVPKELLCGTSTILSEAERGRVPESQGGAVPMLSPFDRQQLNVEQRLSGNKPDVEVHGKVKRIEKFKIERVK